MASIWAPCRSSARALTVSHLEAQRQLEALLPRRRRATPGVCEEGLSILSIIQCGSGACWTDLDRLGKARSRALAPTPGGSPASFVRARRRSPWCQTRSQPPQPPQLGPQARGPPERSDGAATSATSSPRRSSSSAARPSPCSFAASVLVVNFRHLLGIPTPRLSLSSALVLVPSPEVTRPMLS